MTNQLLYGIILVGARPSVPKLNGKRVPLIYVAFIVIRAAILKGATDTVLYPYFFLNIDELGAGGFCLWVSVLTVIFIAIGYVIYLLDNFRAVKDRIFNKGD